MSRPFHCTTARNSHSSRLDLALRPLALACLLTVASIPVEASAQALSGAAPAVSINLPAQSLQASIHALARQSGVAISADAALLAGKQTPAVAGRMTLADALRQLLAGTGLVALEQGSAVIVRPATTAGAVTLGEVKVTATTGSLAEQLPGAYSGGQVAKGARIGLLGNVDVMDTPFNVTAYTSQLIADQQSSTLAGVLRNDPSVRFTTSDGHNAENVTIRGFDVNSSEVALNGMYGLLPGAHIPTEFIERVEVFKGPGAMLSGIAPSGSVGGVINLVPKRAGDKPLTRLTTSYTSQSKLGLAADVGQRFGEEQRLGIRVNGSYANGKTGVDDQKKLERFASVGMDYRGDNWTVELDAYAIEQNQANGSPLMVGFTSLGYVLKAPSSSANALRGTFAKQNSEGASIRGEYEFNDDWSAYAALGTGRYRYDGYLNGTRVVVNNAEGDARGQTYNQAGFTRTLSAEAGVRGNFKTGLVGHRLVVSVANLHVRSGLGKTSTSADYTTNIYNPIDNPTLADAHGAAVKTNDNTFTSLALSDTLSMWDEKALLTLGARAQRVRQTMSLPAYDKSAITPAVGLVVKPWGPSVSLYANYIEGLSAGTTVGSTYANQGDTFAPYKTKQAETGVKWEYGSFTNTWSLFRINKPSTISVPNGTSKPTLVLDGEQRNSGLEWNVFGQVSSQVRVLGGIAYTRAEQVKTASASNAGKSVAGVPKWTANLGTEWDTPWIPGLTLDARATYTSAQYLDDTNTLRIPSWTRFDVGARYATRIASKAVVFRANIDNLADRDYWTGRFGGGYATLSAPRTYKLSATVDF